MDESEFIDIVKDGVCSVFGEFKTVPSALIAVSGKSGEKENVFFADLDGVASDKRHIIRLIQETRLSSSISAFVSEVWLHQKGSDFVNEAIKNGKNPADDPGCTEAVMAYVYIGMRVRLMYAEILRPTDGDPILMNWKEVDGKPSGDLMTPPPSWN